MYDRRTGTEVLDEELCWELLDGEEVGRLAVSIAGQPDIFPVNHVVDGRSIVFRTAAGTKLAGAVLGRGVAYEVDGYDAAAGEAWSVVVKGAARQLEPGPERYHVETLPLFPWNATPKYDLVRIDAAEVSGRRFRVVDRGAAGGT